MEQGWPRRQALHFSMGVGGHGPTMCPYFLLGMKLATLMVLVTYKLHLFLDKCLSLSEAYGFRMYKTKDELYEIIKDRIDRKDFESKIANRTEKYEGLLSPDAVAYLIADELGVNIAETAHISGLVHGDTANLDVRVEEIGGVREFKRKNGTKGQVINITISDDTGQCRLTLWDKEVEYVRTGQISPGSHLRIINGYIKVTDFGMEVNLGRWGSFIVR